MIEIIANTVYYLAENDPARHSLLFVGIILSIILMHMRAKNEAKKFKLDFIKHVHNTIHGYSASEAIKNSTAIIAENERCLGYVVGEDYARKFYQYCMDLKIEPEWWPKHIRNIHRIRKEGLEII